MKKLLFTLTIFAMLVLCVGPNAVSALDSIEIVSVNYPSVVAPGQTFSFSVTVKVNDGQLLESRGDMLRNTDGNLFGHWPHIAVVGTVNAGSPYTFNSYGSGMTAPSAEGTYQSVWRVWRNGAYVGPEAIIRFEVRNGGGGGGGGTSLICPGTELPSTISGSFHRSVKVPASDGGIIEWAAEISGQYCKSQSTLSISSDGLTISGPTGTVSIDNELNLVSDEITIGKDYVQAISGILLTTNTEYPGHAYYGDRYKQSTGLLFSYLVVSSQYEVRHIMNPPTPSPNYNYAYVPSLNLSTIVYLANAKKILTSPGFVMLISFVVVAYNAALALMPVLLLAPSIGSNDVHSVNLVVQPIKTLDYDPVAEGLFIEQYGATRDWANLSGLASSRSIASAYTEFSISGSGFSPNSDVYYEFGLPGHDPLLKGVVKSDDSGNVEIPVVMPDPAQVALGTYLFSAFDNQGVDQARQQLFNNELSPSHFSVGVATIDVVEDVTPPTITINTPTATTYTRCDQPTLNYEVTDDLSGVASATAWLDGVEIQNGATLDMLFWNLGAHSIDIQAFDKVGNEQNQHLDFQLGASVNGSLCALDRFDAMKLFKINGTYASIRAHLISADRALAANKPLVAKNQFRSILQILEAQQKQIDLKAYNILVMDMNALMETPVR